MDAASIVNIALPAVFVVVGIALVWLLVELVRTLKAARDTLTQLQPTLNHVEKITKELGPAMERVDPLVERITLTVDAANLELMRVDQILENVGEISGTVTNATNALDSVTQAPLKAVTNVSNKVRQVFSPLRASEESTRLAEGSSQDASAEAPLTAEAPASEFAAQAPVEGAEASEVDPAQRYYTYAAPAASVVTKVPVPEVPAVADTSENITETISFEEQETGEIPVVNGAHVAETAEGATSEQAVDFSDLFGEHADERPAAPEAAQADIAALDALADSIAPEDASPEAAVEAIEAAGEEVDAAIEAAEVAEAVEAGLDPASIADQLAVNFADEAIEDASGSTFVESDPAAVAAFAAGSALEVGAQQAAAEEAGAEAVSAVDAALAAAKARIAAKAEDVIDEVMGEDEAAQ